MKDLFGVEVSPLPARKRHRADKAHAAAPGTGPCNETCGSCGNLTWVKYARTYYKCLLQRPLWTGGPGTDIRCKDPACYEWIPKEARSD